MSEPIELPPIPAPVSEFISYLAENKDKDVQELAQPYREFESKLREVYAQEPDHEASKAEFFNIVPLFNGQENEITIRSRDLDAESEEQKSKYIFPLKYEDRREHGSPAVSTSLKEFQEHFTLFSESSLSGLDWSNIVAAGSSVTTPLMPIPEEYADSKRSMRKWYHEKVAPASDVDLFIHGLTEEEAVEKIKAVERAVRDSILSETTTVRTKNAITIASQYPTRHVQIVLRTYKNISEILTGFDVDCACAAYDGKQVYATPRALASFVTQINTIDLTRRSPSYENRLSKYSRRGFEVYWSDLDRSLIDPTIFERSFPRTLGLARLLVLEKLPTSTEREAYIDERRHERGRPQVWRSRDHILHGNIKDQAEDEVADWVTGDEVSSYHTFTVPYGQRFNAKKIEKLLYTKDLLLNAEWNQPKNREVYLHRHPAFFGRVKHVIGDCCGYCPIPQTEQEKQIADEESKIFISGKVEFLHDDPGRQRIGSFNPLTADDWTEMAYVSKTGVLCNAIVECDLSTVQKWLEEEQVDPFMRDYTGRTPLQLAAMCSTPEIAQCLIDHGVRISARMADGRTALHIAALRGNVGIVKAILDKSEENEQAEAEKDDAKPGKSKNADIDNNEKHVEDEMDEDGDDEEKDEEEDDGEEEDDDNEDNSQDPDIDMVDLEDEDEDVDMETRSRGSFVHVKKKGQDTENVPEDEGNELPDVYDINMLSWDIPSSPLHLAIANGHVNVVEQLVSTYGADVLLPVKLVDSMSKEPRAAILTLVLATVLDDAEADTMVRKLLDLGASSAQAVTNLVTAYHYIVKANPKLVETLIEQDKPAVFRALNQVALPDLIQSSHTTKYVTPLLTAVESKDRELVSKMLEMGAKSEVSFEGYMKANKASGNVNRYRSKDTDANREEYFRNVQQPVIAAVLHYEPEIVRLLIETGQADVNTLTTLGYNVIYNKYMRSHHVGQSLLDKVRQQITSLKGYNGEKTKTDKPKDMKPDSKYLSSIPKDTYQEWATLLGLKYNKLQYEELLQNYQKDHKEVEEGKGAKEKEQFFKALVERLMELEKFLLEQGAKGFYELHTDIEPPKEDNDRNKFRRLWVNGPEPADFKARCDFEVGDLNDEKREAYVKIFEAAWVGDIETIKAYTLQRWGEDNQYEPLEISITDSNHQTAFHIAMLRGNREVASQILEICHAQYQPLEEPMARYHIAGEDDYDGDEVGSERGDDEFQLYSEIVNNEYTIETIGEVADQVRSSTSPLDLISKEIDMRFFTVAYDPKKKPQRPQIYNLNKKMVDMLLGILKERPNYWHWSLIEFAIAVNDISLVEFILDCQAKYKESSESPSSFPQVEANKFNLAVAHGRIEILELLIRRTGAGIPLDDMVKQSGAKLKEKPLYYLGLSVYGKKRKDWAERGRGATYNTVLMDAHPPLLEAASLGCLKSLEWFLSDTPLRLYKSFANQYKDDKRLKVLAETKGGVEQAITGWYKRNGELLVHCCVLARPSKQKSKLLELALEANPESLHARSPIQGLSPLQLAVMKGYLDVAKQLIQAGADQTCRDKDGDNLLHTILRYYQSNFQHKNSAPLAFQFIDLIDKRVLPSLFCERNREETGRTPLALWLSLLGDVVWRCETFYKDVAVQNSPKLLELLLDKSAGSDLTMMDGSGQLPLHQCVRDRLFYLLEPMYRRDGSLIFRENATGMTPFEIAQEQVLRMRFRDPPKLSSTDLLYRDDWNLPRSRDDLAIITYPAENFIKEEPKEGEHKWPEDVSEQEDYDVSQLWKIITSLKLKSEEAESRSTIRKLVTLTEANEVAKRLAERKRHQEQDNRRQRRTRENQDGSDNDAPQEDEQPEETDYVNLWINRNESAWSASNSP